MKCLFSKPDNYFARCGRLDCAVRAWRIDGAPAFLRGLRALFISDTHVLKRTTAADIRALADRAAALAPDLLLLGGDYADRAEDALRLFEVLGELKPPLGAFGVLGNNDAEAWPDVNDLRKVMARAGVQLLVNEAATLPVNGGRLILGGVDEHKLGRPDARGLLPEASAPDAYRVLLSHYPCPPNISCDLMLSGHTHGGQFNLLGLTPFSIGFERLFRKDIRAMAVAGLHEMSGMKLLVSKGIGASRLQWRIGVRPEIDWISFD